MRYYKRYWDENPGGDRVGWGNSWWYFESDSDGNVVRQVTQYENGPTLRYSDDHFDDEFGGLAKIALDLADFAQFEVTRDIFEIAWEV